METGVVVRNAGGPGDFGLGFLESTAEQGVGVGRVVGLGLSRRDDWDAKDGHGRRESNRAVTRGMEVCRETVAEDPADTNMIWIDDVGVRAHYPCFEAVEVDPVRRAEVAENVKCLGNVRGRAKKDCIIDVQLEEEVGQARMDGVEEDFHATNAEKEGAQGVTLSRASS
jgi:hypothetical protein